VGVRPTISPVTISASSPARRLALLAAAAIAIPIAGCGSSSDSSGSGGAGDPAKAIPASASFYLEATVRPTGKQRTDLEAALGKILRTSDPGAKLVQLIDKSQDNGQTFEKDVKPWLGDKAAVAITGFTAGKPDYAVVVNSTDDDKARNTLEADKDYSAKRSYEGVDYRVNPKEGDAQGVTDGFAIDGTESGFKQVVHLLKKGGDSLASNQDLQDARDKVGGRPGFMFVGLQALLRQAASNAASTLGPSQLSAINGLFKRFRAFGVGIGADAQAIRLSVATLGEGGGTGNGPGSALPLDKAPGDSWLALTQSDIGKTVSGVLDSLKGATGDQITQFETATGLKVKEDLLSWMGDASLFVEGDSVPALGGAFVIQSTDPAKTRVAIAKIKGLMRQFNARLGPAPAGASAGFSMGIGDGGSKPVLIGLAGSRFVVAYGEKAFRDATHPSSTLSSSANFKSASGLLGGTAKPSFYLDFQTLTRFISLIAGDDKDFAKAKPYLDAFTAVIGGGSGDRKAEIAIGLK
jgi:hypothetical protein